MADASKKHALDEPVLLGRIADALERLAPPPIASALPEGDAFVWEPVLRIGSGGGLVAVPQVAHVDLALLKGIENQRETLLSNTRHFAQGLPANNALLWGARGMGKSSLVKAVHEEINRGRKGGDRLVLIEIHREDIDTLPTLLRILRTSSRRIILFCDDLSFDKDDTSYKSLKAALEGGIEGRPDNVILYAAGGAGTDLGAAETDALVGGGLELAVSNDLSVDARYLHGVPMSGADTKEQLTVGANFHF